MFSLLVLILSTVGIFSFPQNNGQEGNFGYDPFGGTFPHHVPMNLEYVPPPIEHPALRQTAKDSYGSYVPMVDGKPIYIPEVYHDGFVFRDLTLPDPDGPPPVWQQDQEASFSPDPTSVQVEPLKKIKTHHSKRKQRYPPKGVLGARSVKPHKKPAVHKAYDEPAVDTSVVKRPIGHRPTYNYDAIKKFLEEEHDFSDYVDDHGRPVDIIEPEIKKEVTIEVFPKKEKPVTHKKPIKQKTHGYRETPIVEAFSNKKKHGEKPVHEKVEDDEYDKPVVVEVLSKKERSETPVETADSDEDYDTPTVVEVLTKKEHATDKKDKPVHAVVSDGETIVKIPSKHKKPPTVVHVKPGKTEYPVSEEKYDSDVSKPLIDTEKPGVHENPEDIVYELRNEILTPKNESGKFIPCGIPNPHPQKKVVGGKNSTFGSWPWQVSVRRTSFFDFPSTHRCGGALISRQWVATAAHCVDDLKLSQIKIRVGEYDFGSVQEPLGYVERGAKKKVVHPRYNISTFENDLAVVQLDEPIDSDAYPHVSTICLPPTEESLVGRNATVIGWGRLSIGGVLPSMLQEVQLPIISNEECKNMFLAAGIHESIPEIFMCVDEGGRDSCKGESGGPLQIQTEDGYWFLAGIISWGIGCAEPNMPVVCTRISKFKDWIVQQVV